MKFSKGLWFVLLIALSGCRNNNSSSATESQSSSETNSVSSSETNSETSSQSSSEVNSQSSSESSSVSSSEELPTIVPLNFLAINDFHGAITENPDSGEPGIFKLASYIKSVDASNNGELIKINVGDYWQGSADSNLNRGKFLTEVGNVLGFDAMTIGNHEFDWMDTHIAENKELADYPFLGANILNKATRELATNLVSYDDTFKNSLIVKKNGVNVGIIGTIGSGLESSILAAAVAPYTFEPVDQYIRSEASNLRKLGADVIVLSTHDSLKSGAGEYSGVINDKVVDLIFSGHQHVTDNKVINGIPILQTNGNGKQVMEVGATFNFETKEFKVTDRYLTYAAKIMDDYLEDAEVRALFDNKYVPDMAEIINEEVGHLSDEMDEYSLAELAVDLLHEYGVKELGYNSATLVSVHNTGGVRARLSPGVITYGDVYKAFPFDNEVRIIENISGKNLNSFISYHVASSGYIDSSKTYNLITIDYLSTYEKAVTANMPQILTGQFVRELIADYFRNQTT